MIRWETTRKTKSIDIKDVQKYSISDKSPRKRKPTEFFLPQPDAKIPSSIMQSDENITTENEIKNKFYSYNNSAKLCAEGALVNLMGGLGCSEEDIKVFWDIVFDQFLQSVCAKLDETCVPKNVYQKGGEFDSIENSLWVLRKKIHFDTTTRMKEISFQNLRNKMNFSRI